MIIWRQYFTSVMRRGLTLDLISAVKTSPYSRSAKKDSRTVLWHWILRLDDWRLFEILLRLTESAQGEGGGGTESLIMPVVLQKTNAIMKLIVFRVGGSERSQHLLGADRAESMDHNWPQGRGTGWRRIGGWAGVLFGMLGVCSVCVLTGAWDDMTWLPIGMCIYSVCRRRESSSTLNYWWWVWNPSPNAGGCEVFDLKSVYV